MFGDVNEVREQKTAKHNFPHVLNNRKSISCIYKDTVLKLNVGVL
jgi:hypothetical protein